MEIIEEIWQILRKTAADQANYGNMIMELKESSLRVDAQLAMFDAHMVELKEAQLKTDKQLAKTDAQLAKTDAQLAKTDAQLAKTDAQLAKTDSQLAKTDAKLFNIGVNIGQTAEEFFYYALEDKPYLGSVRFDEVVANTHLRYKKIEDEFDIIMYNGDSIALIEIKHKVHPNDLETLVNKKLINFRILFEDYARHKIYLGIGGFSIPKEVEDKARKQGIAVLRQKGQLVDIHASHLLAY